MVKKVNAIIGFQVACANNQTISYVIDLKNGSGSVFVNNAGVKPECTISIGDDDLASILEGKLNMMNAFTQKKLKISGNMSIAMKLNQVFASVAKAKSATSPVPVPETPKTPEPKKTTTAQSSLSSTTAKHKSGKFFEEIEAKIKVDGASLVKKVNAVIGFQVECGNEKAISYVVDLKSASGSVFVNDGG